MSRGGGITDLVEVMSGDPRVHRQLPAGSRLLLSETIRLVFRHGSPLPERSR